MDWTEISAIITLVLLVLGGLFQFFRSRSKNRVDTFTTIMQAGKEYRDELRKDLEDAKEKIESLQEQLDDYQSVIDDLQKQLTAAVELNKWSYHFLQKPISIPHAKQIMSKYLSKDKNHEIILVEDDVELNKSLMKFIKENNWVPYPVSTGFDAVQLTKINIPDLIIIDLCFPVNGLFDFLHEFHKCKALSEVPVIIVSGKKLSKEDRENLHRQMYELLKEKTNTL